MENKKRNKSESLKKAKLKGNVLYPHFEAGETLEEIAKKFQRSISTISVHRKKWEKKNKEKKRVKQTSKIEDTIMPVIVLNEKEQEEFKKKLRSGYLLKKTQEELDDILEKRLAIFSIEALNAVSSNMKKGHIDDKFLIAFLSKYIG